MMDLHRMERWSTSSPGRFEWWAHCTYCDHESPRFTTNEGWENHLHNAQVAHQAVEIDKALGELTREWGVVVAYPPRPDDGYPGAVVTLDWYRQREGAESLKRMRYPEDDYEIRSRWVSGWSEVQR